MSHNRLSLTLLGLGSTGLWGCEELMSSKTSRFKHKIRKKMQVEYLHTFKTVFSRTFRPQ